MTQYVDEAGRLWGGFDSQFGYCGGDMTEAVRRLFREPGWLLDQSLPPNDYSPAERESP